MLFSMTRHTHFKIYGNNCDDDISLFLDNYSNCFVLITKYFYVKIKLV